MRQDWYKFLLFLLLVTVLAATPALAANGKISGTVKSAEGEPVVGANVVIEGTTLGAAVDPTGKYFILNVPPGTYRVRASGVGFVPKVTTGVLVEQDQVVTLDIRMETQAVGLAEVVVQAERPIVDKSQTSSKSTLTSDQIDRLPINSAVGMIATSASAFNGFIRGGRINESKTIVDGVDVSDQYYAYAADQTHTAYQTYDNVPRYRGSEVSKIGNFNFGAVEQLNINTGAVGAEYSSATAGVINYSLREGGGAFHGNLQARVSQFNGLSYNGPNIYWNDNIYMKEKSDLSHRVDSLQARVAQGLTAPTLSSDLTRLGFYTYSPGKYVTEKPQMEFEGSFSGQIVENLGFYFTGRYFDSHGRLPNELYREAAGTLKMNYNITGAIKLTGFGILTDRGRLFGWLNRGYNESARFFLEGTPQNDGLDWIGSLKLTHVLDPSSFYEVQLSATNSLNTTGYIHGSTPGSVAAPGVTGDFITLETLAEANQYISNTDLTKFFRNQDETASSTSYQFNAGGTTARLARPGFFYEDYSNKVYTIKGDYTNQITANHRLQAGAQGRFTNLDMTRRASYLGAVDPRKQFYTEIWDMKPTEYGFYAQDRMEYAGLIINLGARVDYWDPDAQDYGNYFAPYQTTNVMVDTLPGVPIAVLDRVPIRGRKVDPYWFFSPRIGVSHPISDVAAMYFSYSRNTTPPPYSRMYANYSNFGNISLPNNPSLRQQPYKSNNYELGVQWEFIPKFGLNFTAYLRDIENYGYTSFGVTPRSSIGQLYYLGFSAGYADTRGIEVTLEAQRHSFFDNFLTVTGQASYAYSYVKASSFAGLDSKMQTAFSTTNGDSARLGGDLPLTDINFYNKIQTDVLGSNSTLLGGFDRAHRISYQLILGFPYDIMLSSVGTFQSGFYYPLTMTDARVAGREFGEGPWNKNVDVRLEKGFNIGGYRLALYVDATNVFNWTNILGYDNSATGATLWEKSMKAGSPDPTGSLGRAVGPDGTYFYGFPRQYYFGVRMNF